MNADNKHVYFRANVGIVVMNQAGLVLACERSGVPGAWQLPQGGMQQGEEPLDAAYRELEEETGIAANKTELVAEYPEWLAYELPEGNRNAKKGRGQVQKWFFLRFNGKEKNIRLGHEFRSWKWMPLADLASVTAEFRRPIYQKLAQHFGNLQSAI